MFYCRFHTAPTENIFTVGVNHNALSFRAPSALLRVNSARNLLFRRVRANPLVQKQILRFAQDDSQRGCLVPMAERSTPFAKTVWKSIRCSIDKIRPLFITKLVLKLYWKA